MKTVELLNSLFALPREAQELVYTQLGEKLSASPAKGPGLKKASPPAAPTAPLVKAIKETAATTPASSDSDSRPGRKLDPNSNAGKVRAAVTALLSRNPAGVAIKNHMDSLVKKTGLDEKVIQSNMYTIPGVTRVDGIWKKA